MKSSFPSTFHPASHASPVQLLHREISGVEGYLARQEQILAEAEEQIGRARTEIANGNSALSSLRAALAILTRTPS